MSKTPYKILCSTVLLAMTSCSPQQENPESVVETFFQCIAERNANCVWELLTQKDQRHITDRINALQTGKPEKFPANLAQGLFAQWRLKVLVQPKGFILASRPADRVNIHVASHSGKSITIPVIKEEGKWKVSLLEAAQMDSGPKPIETTKTSSTT